VETARLPRRREPPTADDIAEIVAFVLGVVGGAA
jgi:hypothetical protein